MSGRLIKWAIEIGPFYIEFKPRVSMKGQVVADFLAEVPSVPSVNIITVPETKDQMWILHTDGSSNSDGSGASLILRSPEGDELTYAIRFSFPASNNEAEYEALLAGLRLAKKMGATHLTAHVDSLLVASQIVGTKADALSKLASVAFEHLAKEIRVELLESPKVNIKIAAEVKVQEESWMSPINRGKNGSGEDYESRVLLAMDVSQHLGGASEMSSLSSTCSSVIPAEIGIPSHRLQVQVSNNEEELRTNLDLIEERREITAIRESHYKKEMAKYYNAKVKVQQYKVGEYVLRSNEVSRALPLGKMSPKWEGPYIIKKAIGNGSYILQQLDGTELVRAWNGVHLRKCYM
ncbi:hypothetical protein SSX86_002185 [Deinandra increscens subsp. villosa]|uniref:RNase H type-1 domain-containing protein n=1 Tax=Deinandra increscens subsp. villosa TaxID=3103831 RepID=A0AAP0DVX3_9ASTR